MTRKKTLAQNNGQRVASDPTKVTQHVPELQVPEEFQAILGKLTHDEQLKIKSVIITSFQSYSGPLPAPESLEKYNSIIPNGAERIMKMAENQSGHRIKIEDTVVSGQVKQSGRGQIFGLVIAFFTISSSVVLAILGHDVVAGVIGGGTVISLATVFVLGKKTQETKLKEKRESIESSSAPQFN